MPPFSSPFRCVHRHVGLLILVLHLVLLVAINGVVAQNCYYPNQQIAPGLTPCNASASVSHCCDQDSVCLDNGYCMNQHAFGNRIGRGACTDKSFTSSACPYYCLDELPAAGISVMLVVDSEPGLFCCGPGVNSSMCLYATRDSTKPFALASGAVIYNRTSGSTAPNATVATVAASTATVTVTSLVQNGSGGGGGGGASNNNDDVPIGVGVGVSLGVVLLLVLALLGVQTRRVKNLQRDLRAVVPGASSEPFRRYKSLETSHQLQGQPVSELSDGHRLAELRA